MYSILGTIVLAAAQASQAPAIVPAPPPAAIPAPLRDSLRFGYLDVPRLHDDPASGTFRLALIVLPALGPAPRPDPIVFIPGGPGMPAIEPWAAEAARAPRIALLRENRDFVILEPRGHGLSEPHACSETGPPPLDETSAAAAAGFVRQLQACRRRMEAAGIRLDGLRSTDAARDLDLLRRALGAPQLNLLAGSYGTRIATEAMRTVPDAIRSVALLGPVPPGVTWRSARDGYAAARMRRLFERCAAQPACRTAFPALAADYDTLIVRARRSPIVIALPPSDRVPEGRLVFDDVRLASALAQLLAYRELAAGVPLLIHMLVEHGPDPLARAAPELAEALDETDDVALTTYLAFRCNDATGADAAADGLAERCPALLGEQAGRPDDRALRSAIPALVFAGELDTRTPPELSRVLAVGLPRAHLFDVPWHGHEYALPCLNRMEREFFDAPARRPADGCLDSLPPIRFATAVVPSRWTSRAASITTANPGLAAPVLGATLLLLLAPAVALPLTGRRRRRADHPSPTTSGDGWLLWAGVLVAVLLVVGAAAALAAGARQALIVPMLGLPREWSPVLALPWLLAALAAALAARAVGAPGARAALRGVWAAVAIAGIALVLGAWGWLALG